MPLIYLLWAGVYFTRFLIRPLYLRASFGRNLRVMLAGAAFLWGGVFLLLAELEGARVPLFAVMGYYALIDTLYWLVYHVYFAELGYDKKRGREIFMRELFLSAASAAAPLFGALFIAKQGYGFIWIAAAAIAVLSITPLFFTRNVRVPRRFGIREALRVIPTFGFWYYFSAAIYDLSFAFVWGLVLYLTLGDIVAFGFVLTLAVIMKVIAYWLMGRAVDHHRVRRLHFLGLAFIAVLIGARVFLAWDIPRIVAIDAMLVIAGSLVYPLLESRNYNSSKTSESPLWYQFFAESGYDLGAMIALVFVASFSAATGVLRPAMLFGIVGIVLLAYILIHIKVRSGTSKAER